MKINVYYGGRGIIDDPSLYVISKMTDVLKELNVQVEQFNLFEQKNNITALPNSLKDADGIILASTVEWYGIGGYMLQFLDACWLYGDKEKISRMYMLPVVMSTTYGEREGMMNLSGAWEILGGLPCDGICGYIADTMVLESKEEYTKLIEKKAENLYRTINQKIPGLPASNQAVKKMVAISKSVDLTPQESEQLSQYASDDKYVQTQKEDIQELASLFKTRMNKDDGAGTPEEYMKKFRNRFKPVPGVKGKYSITVTDQSGMKPLFLDIDGTACKVTAGIPDGTECDVAIQIEKEKLDEITSGRMTFQRAFMAGNMKMKGDFKLLRSMDQIFSFMES